MSILVKLSSLALRPALGGIARLVLKGMDVPLGEEAVTAVENFLVSRFTDPSQQLRSALGRAAEHSWRAVEVALSGETLWSWLTDRGEDKAFRADIRTFLDSNPLQLPVERDDAFRKTALQQLRLARKTGLIPGEDEPAKVAGKQVADFLRFASPGAVCEAEWRVVGGIAGSLREARHTALADLLELRPVESQPPLLAIAVRFFFRREVETNPHLFQGLMYDQVDQIGEALEAGLMRLHDVLQLHGERLLTVLTRVEAIHADVMDMKEEQTRMGQDVQELCAEVKRLGEKQNRLHERNVSSGDTQSIRSEGERELVKAIKAKFRSLPEEKRRELPALLSAISKLELAAGDLEAAQQDFQQVAALVSDRAAKASAHHGAYLAAVEKRNWSVALQELMEAARLAPERFAPFPLEHYTPERILGAGTFGVAFLCRNRLSKIRVVVKVLRADVLDRDLNTVVEEALTLESLQHPAIVRLRDCGWADPQQTRPYLVMDYIEGMTLEKYVKKMGRLSLEEVKQLARQLARGLHEAHRRGVVHRDVKPANVLLTLHPEIRNALPNGYAYDYYATGGPLSGKLIDFGLTLRDVKDESEPPIRLIAHDKEGRLILPEKWYGKGNSVVGTPEYAAPEQMGKFPEFPIGPRSDVYGFGRMLCYALFGTPHPSRSHWRELKDERFSDLLEKCIEDDPSKRRLDFEDVIVKLEPAVGTSSKTTENDESDEDDEARRRESEALYNENRKRAQLFFFRLSGDAAEEGDAAAQHDLAQCYEEGNGTDKDYEKAICWYRNAAEGGIAAAQFAMGVIFPQESKKWWRQAAAQGHKEAQFQLQAEESATAPLSTGRGGGSAVFTAAPDGTVTPSEFGISPEMLSIIGKLDNVLRANVKHASLRDHVARQGHEDAG